ncbi:MAG: GH25 family lysozyme, partial [Dehalococcoidia bacterium]
MNKKNTDGIWRGSLLILLVISMLIGLVGIGKDIANPSHAYASSTYVSGIDVSHWQGDINWTQVYNAGYRFAFVKATGGDSDPPQIIDEQFHTNMTQGRNAGMLMGAYHFAYPQYNNAADEARFFVSVAGSYFTDGYLRPVLDVENCDSVGKESLSNWIDEFMTTVETETGVEPILYVNSNYANNYLNSSINQYDLWIAHWRCDTTTPPNIGIWSDWSFWQYYGPEYCGENSVPGITEPVDLDVFNGDLTGLQNEFGIVSNHPPIASASDISGQPQTMNPDTLYEVTAKYYDPDGRSNLKLCTLGLNHPTTAITMGWGEDLKIPVVNSEYITSLEVAYTLITGSYEGYQLTWKFKLAGTWPQADNCIDFFVNAIDDANSQTDIEFNDTNASFAIPDTTDPAISITFPSNGASFTSPAITVTGTSSDNAAVAQVEVKVGSDDWQLSTGTNSWNKEATLTVGSNTIYAKATDTSGRTTETSIIVTYNSPDTACPVISITSPSDGASFTTPTITVSGTASDNVAVQKVEVKVGSGDWQLSTGTNSW